MSDTIARQRIEPSPLAELARAGYLARYKDGTRDLYAYDLELFFSWCTDRLVDPLEVKRPHLEAFSEWLMTERGNGARSACRRLQTIRAFFKLATADELIARDPSTMMRMPRWFVDPTKIPYVRPREIRTMIDTAAGFSPAHHALIGVMGYLGLRVSEACGLRVEDFTTDRNGYMVVAFTRKGGALAVAPVPVPLMKILEPAIDGRTEGHLILTKAGRPQNRRGAYDWFKRVLRRAGLPEELHPHSMRHGAARMLLDAGATLEEVQQFMGHADIRTTRHYTIRPIPIDRHGAFVAARELALSG